MSKHYKIELKNRIVRLHFKIGRTLNKSKTHIYRLFHYNTVDEFQLLVKEFDNIKEIEYVL